LNRDAFVLENMSDEMIEHCKVVSEDCGAVLSLAQVDLLDYIQQKPAIYQVVNPAL